MKIYLLIFCFLTLTNHSIAQNDESLNIKENFNSMSKMGNNKKVIVPPIKSQGIKTKLVSWIMDLAPIVDGRWIEPFLGTGVVAFNSGYKKAILNDTNPHIFGAKHGR